MVTDIQREKRRLILRAAITVFARSGYHTSRVSDVAKEAGVAYGLVYHYFGSKEDLLETIFRRTWSRMLEAVEEVERSEATAREQLAGVARIVLGSWELDPDLVRVLVREVARSPQLAREVDEIEHAFAALERIVVRGQERGELRPGLDPRYRRVGPLRRARGDPHRLGLRAAADRRRGGRACRADGCRAAHRRPRGGLICQSISTDSSVNRERISEQVWRAFYDGMTVQVRPVPSVNWSPACAYVFCSSACSSA